MANLNPLSHTPTGSPNHSIEIPLKQKCLESKSITIVDAKDSGMKSDEVWWAIEGIAKKELKGSQGWVSASDYVKDEYFSGVSIVPGISSPEAIFLAKVDDKIAGFIITAKRKDGDDSFYSLPSDSGYVAYLAVDSKNVRSGVGTKLMLAAMKKTKELGKRYLSLEYIAEGLGVDENKGKARTGFYNSFTKRFGIPMEIKRDVFTHRRLYVHLCYDLQNVDFSFEKASTIQRS